MNLIKFHKKIQLENSVWFSVVFSSIASQQEGY